MARKVVVALAAVLAVAGWFVLQPSERPWFERLEPLHAPHPPVRPGDWLAEHPERGESFGEYVKANPVRPVADRRTIYLQPLGEFSPAQLRVLEQTADYLRRFYQLPVTTLPILSSANVPRRGEQLLTTHILFQILVPARPADALSVLALTSEDLYPGPGWNFVFGEASTTERVGVWSLFRNGEPGTGLYLSRTLKTAAHELGHMISMQHCVAWSCVMDGSNSLEEADRQPSSLCPVCLRKLAWNVGLDPIRRFEDLAAFHADAGTPEEHAFIQRQLDVLR